MNRVLGWDGCVNVRDLGGLPTEDGGVTRRGAVVRSDTPGRLTDAGWEALVAHGVRTVVDLRAAEELGDAPPREAPVEVVRSALMGEWDSQYLAEVAAWLDGKDRTGIVAALLLRLAGVPAEQVADDYARTAGAAPREAMLGVLAEVDRRHGGVEGYLRFAGLDDAQLLRLRERLR